MKAEGDTGKPAIREHEFEVDEFAWGACKVCGLARAAHESGPLYQPHGAYRCPECVSLGRKTCVHHQTRRPEP
jgi:hypothetical protein